jgi:hypothetical protein
VLGIISANAREASTAGDTQNGKRKMTSDSKAARGRTVKMVLVGLVAFFGAGAFLAVGAVAGAVAAGMMG